MDEKRQTCPKCRVTRFGNAEYCVCGHRWLVAIPPWLADKPVNYGKLYESLFGHFDIGVDRGKDEGSKVVL